MTGKPVSARAAGSEAALERVSIHVDGQTLTIRANPSGWGGYPGRQDTPATIALTTPDLATAILLGSGSLAVDRMKAPRVAVTVEGSGRAAVNRIEADAAALAVAGSGGIEAGGHVSQLTALARGAAEIRASGLAAADLTLTSESAGTVSMQASRSAKVDARGVGPIDVAGNAACLVTKTGAGPLKCGK